MISSMLEGKKTGIELHFNQISQSNQTMYLGKITVISHVSIACEEEKLHVRRENCDGLCLY
jgi:hypothetical protein